MFRSGFEKIAVSKKWVNERVVGGLATRAGFRRRGGMHRAMTEAAGKTGVKGRFFPTHAERYNIAGVNKATKGDSHVAGQALRHHQAMDRARQVTTKASDDLKKAAGRRQYFGEK